MIFPIGDAPNPEGTPLVTYGLIAANVAVYLLTLPLTFAAPDVSDPLLSEYVHQIARQTGYRVSVQEVLARMSAYDLLVYRWGYRPAAPSLVALFTSMFLHGGLAHLAGNMLFLWIYGDNVEHRLGRGRFLFYYLATGAVATLFHAMFFPSSGVPLVGASGAISGVLGFYFLWFPRNRVHLLLLFPFLVRMVIPARTLLGLYIVVENILPFVLARGAGGVAHGAHIGGFIAGLALARWYDVSELRTPPPEYAGRRFDTAGAGVGAALARGDHAEAARRYFALAPEETRLLLQPEELMDLADWLLRSGRQQAALVALRRYLRDYPAGPGAADAHLGVASIQMRRNQHTAAYQHLLDALECNPAPPTEAAVRRALRDIAARQPLSRAGR